VLVRGRQVFARSELTGSPGQGRWVRPNQALAAVGSAT